MRRKQTNPIKNTGRYRQYTEEKLLSAYTLVKEKGVAVKKAARLYGVPNTTLRDRVKGRIDPENFGNETLFTREEEKKLVEHLQMRAALGYGLSNVYTQRLAGEMAFDMKKKTKNTPLSNHWLYAFLQRWNGEISSVKPSQLESNRAKHSTPEAFETYFQNLEQVLEANNLKDKPHRIYNLDETGCQPEHKPPNVIGNPKSKIQAITSPRTTTTTVIGCANALGNSLPPFFIFKGNRWNPDLMKGACVGARGTMSDSGWSNGEVFREYLEDHFLPFVKPNLDTQDPILLIYDGHASHKGPETIKWAREKGIILFVLPAHSSHLLQPLDVAVFGPFKRHYYAECSRYLYQHMGQNITRYEICALASSAYLKAFSPLNIQSAFRKTGIFPLDKAVIDAEKLFPCESFREERPVEKVKAVKAGPEAVEEFLMKKEQMIKQMTDTANTQEQKNSKKRSMPNASGKEITSDAFFSELSEHHTANTTAKPKRAKKSSKKTTNKETVASPKPSTSGIQANQVTKSKENEDIYSSDNESVVEDSEKCCVCGFYSPPDLKKCQYLKIVSWGQCDKCGHWVHLSFCTQERVVRRQCEFLCPHCK